MAVTTSEPVAASSGGVAQSEFGSPAASQTQDVKTESTTAASPQENSDEHRKSLDLERAPEEPEPLQPGPYDALLEAFNNKTTRAYSALAERVVQWASYAKRALTADELFEAIALHPVELDESEEQDFDFGEALVQVCRKLVRLDDKKSLQHFLEGAYMKQRWVTSKGEGSPKLSAQVNIELGKTCLNYLNRPDISNSSLTRAKLKKACKKFPFLAYAIKHWKQHFLNQDECPYPDAERIIESLFEETSSDILQYDTLLQTIFRLRLLYREEWANLISVNRQAQFFLSPKYKLHYAIALHLPYLVEKYSADDEYLFAKLPQGDLPLTWALRRTSKRMVRILLRRHARAQIIECLNHADDAQKDVDSALRALDIQDPAEEESSTSTGEQAGSPNSPLKQLVNLEEPANPEILRRSSTLMTTAPAENHTMSHDLVAFTYTKQLMKLLLEETSADISPEFLLRHCIRNHITPRSIYSAPDVIDTFLSKRGDLNAPNLFLLHLACRYSAFVVINFLLDRGCDTTIVDELGQNILHHTVQHADYAEGRKILEELVHLHCADPNVDIPSPKLLDYEGRNLLHLATTAAMLEQLLTSEDVDISVDALDNKGRTVLHYVVLREGVQPAEVASMLDLLVEAGAEVGVKDKEGKTPLEYAQDRYPKDDVILKLLDESRAKKLGKLTRKTW